MAANVSVGQSLFHPIYMHSQNSMTLITSWRNRGIIAAATCMPSGTPPPSAEGAQNNLWSDGGHLVCVATQSYGLNGTEKDTRTLPMYLPK